MNNPDSLERWIESELRRRLYWTSAAVPPRPRYRAPGIGGRRPFRLASGAGAALALKAGTGLVVAAFAVTATGTALSGSPNPTTWGAGVHQVVDQCKAASAVEGLGGCVAAVAHDRAEPAPPSEARAAEVPPKAPTRESKAGPAAVPAPAGTPRASDDDSPTATASAAREDRAPELSERSGRSERSEPAPAPPGSRLPTPRPTSATEDAGDREGR